MIGGLVRGNRRLGGPVILPSEMADRSCHIGDKMNVIMRGRGGEGKAFGEDGRF